MKEPDDTQTIMDQLAELAGDLATVTMYTRDEDPDFDFTYYVWVVTATKAALTPVEETPAYVSENLELQVTKDGDAVEMYLGDTYIGNCARVRRSPNA